VVSVATPVKGLVVGGGSVAVYAEDSDVGISWVARSLAGKSSVSASLALQCASPIALLPARKRPPDRNESKIFFALFAAVTT